MQANAGCRVGQWQLAVDLERVASSVVERGFGLLWKRFGGKLKTHMPYSTATVVRCCHALTGSLCRAIFPSNADRTTHIKSAKYNML